MVDVQEDHRTAEADRPGDPAGPGPYPARPRDQGGRRWDLAGPGGLVVEAAVLAGALVDAGLPWRQAYHVSGLTVAVAVAAVVPVALSVAIGGWGRQQALISYGALLAGLAIELVVVVGPHPRAVADGIGRGPSHLLTDTLPLNGPRWVVVVPVVLTWLAASVAGELLVRGRSPGPPLAVVLGSFVVSYAASSAAPGGSMGAGAVLLALVAVVALIHQGRMRGGDTDSRSVGGGGRPQLRAAAGALATAVVAAAVWGGTTSLPGLGSGRTSVTRHPTVGSASAASPVDAIAQLRDADPTAPPTPLLVATTTEPSTGYLALAAFDVYDGDSWTFNRTYLPTGGRVPNPPPADPAALGSLVNQRYVIDRAFPSTLPFVPFEDHPVSVTGLTIDADAPSGTILPAGPVKADTRYDVVSRSPTETLSTLPGTSRIGGAGGTAGIRLPATVSSDLGPTLTYLAAVTRQTPAPTVSFLQALVAALGRTDKRLIPRGPQGAGTSLAEVVSATTVLHVATPEQFATLFVAVARSLGVPARVVTGFRAAPGGGGPLPAGTVTVTNRDAWTWAEIPVIGQGWVVVDPTPAATSSSTLPPATASASPTTTAAPAPQNAVPVTENGGHALAPTVRITTPHHHGLSSWWLAAAVAAGAVVLTAAPFSGAGGYRALRRRRRGKGNPAQQTAGAWLDVVDSLARAGVDPGPWATTAEVASLAGRSFGPDLEEPVRRVGTMADRAVFANGLGVDDPAARQAWVTARQTGRRIGQRLPWAQRLRWALRIGTVGR